MLMVEVMSGEAVLMLTVAYMFHASVPRSIGFTCTATVLVAMTISVMTKRRTARAGIAVAQ